MESDIFYDGTVYTGSAGLAMFYLLCSHKNDDYETLKAALECLNIDGLKGKRISFLCGDAGPLALAAVISYKLGNKRPANIPDYKTLVILYGKAGYLYALLFVNKHINGKEIIPANHIERVINGILKSGKNLSLKEKSDSPLLWQWHDNVYFGAAHGMAGIFYIRPTIDWLIYQQFPSGNFPSSLTSTSGDKLVQWCHGAPGFVFDDDKYMKVAIQLGDVIWQRGLCTKGYSICHGVSGNAYAFLQLYQTTKKPMYLYRAGCFMEWCAVARPGTELHRPDRPASLFEGLLGRLFLAEDICHAMDARFPGFSV
ncbi:GPCRorphan/putative Class B Family, partial [Operophtera brumata]